MAITLGVAAGLILMALISGMISQRFVNLIENQISHVQIHQPGFRTEMESKLYISGMEKLNSSLDSSGMVLHHTPRTLAQGMVASGYGATGVQLVGVQPDTEAPVSEFSRNLISGSYFSEDVRNPLLISERTARKLRVREGERVVLTFQGLDDDIVSAAFRVSGIFRTSNASFDDVHVYVLASDLQQLLHPYRPIWHQVAVITHAYQEAGLWAEAMRREFPDLDIKDWSDLSPEATILVEQGNFFSYIFLVVILLGLAFGILNTMLMAVFERTQELGMLMAIGMKRTSIATMIILETVYLSILGSAMGLLLGFAFVGIFKQEGLNLAGFSDALAEFGYDAVIYPLATQQDIVTVLVLVFCISILAAVIPTLRAVKLNPAEAVRKV
jgi:ABC-type lipoprotein release transport system permease subunit